MNATGTGIGRALKRAREVRGKSLEEASRETRIRTEYLQALEREHFDRLLGDVYVRGFLRSYAGYLGLDADKVLGVYSRTYGGHAATAVPESTPVTPAVSGNAEGHPLIHRRANWGLAGVIAVVVLALVATLALTTGPDDAPPATIPPPPSVVPSALPVVVNLVAVRPIDVRIVVDGEVAFEGRLQRDEARSFEGDRDVEVGIADGGAVRVTVNGRRLGPVGVEGEPWNQTFGPEDFRESPSTAG